MKPTFAHKLLCGLSLTILILVGNSAFTQDTLVAATLVGDWKICVDEGYSVSLDSFYECIGNTTYSFLSDGTYSIFYVDDNALSKEIDTGSWRIVKGVIIMSSRKGDGDRPREDVVVTQMISENRFYELKHRFRKFANGNMKSFPSYTYFVRVD